MSSNVDQLEEQSDLEQGIKITKKRVMEVPTNRVQGDEKFATDVYMESKDKIQDKIL
jgi:hypothetical protein